MRNYPWYRGWKKDFPQNAFTVIGVHTPETKRERDLATVRSKAKEAKFSFPIVVDNKKQHWNAYGTNMWPSVYLIDKRGYICWFWSGELNWKGKKGEAMARKRIQQLLAEKVASSPVSTKRKSPFERPAKK